MKKFDTKVRTHEEREIDAEKNRIEMEAKKKEDDALLKKYIWVEGLLMPRTKSEFN
jgi:hypothetical protein